MANTKSQTNKTTTKKTKSTRSTSTKSSSKSKSNPNRDELIEELKVSGDQVLSTVKRLVKEGNAHSLSIKNEKGKTLITIPLTFGVVGAALLPIWAAVGAIAALLTKCTIVIHKKKK